MTPLYIKYSKPLIPPLKPPIKVDAFRPRTCVKFRVENLEENGYSEITYEADPIQFRDH